LYAISLCLRQFYLYTYLIDSSVYSYSAVGQGEPHFLEYPTSYFPKTYEAAGCWKDIGRGFPFSLSALNLLKNITLRAPIDVTETNIKCALPEIIRLIQTAPAIERVVLGFHCRVFGSITFLGRLDWSLLDRLKSNITGTRPRIDLCITACELSGLGPEIYPESILNALAGNEILMDLVERGLVILKWGRTSGLWNGS
jgi:hypothetical protein